MGLIINKIKDLIARWKKKEEKLDAIIDATLINMQAIGEVIETVQDDMNDLHSILETLKKRQEDLTKRIETIDGKISKMKTSFWYGIFFGKD
jgi:predicted  nucleic acid-binding Zn-ribbon protein